jgi:tetratricopeptide (TPR) repeat protein
MVPSPPSARSGRRAFALARGLLASCLLIAAFASCDRRDDFYVDGLVRMEKGTQGRPAPSEARIEELRREIDRYRSIVEKKVEASQQLGIYYKMLAVAYMRREMYEQAYESLEQAMTYHPKNSVLLYYAGVCAAQVSRVRPESERGLWLDRAESYYRRALELDPDYAEAMYGLAVLDTFERDKLVDAEALARRVLQLRSRDDAASFLLANILYRQGRLREAVAVYREIAGTTQVDASRKEAIANQARIEKEIRGAP